MVFMHAPTLAIRAPLFILVAALAGCGPEKPGDRVQVDHEAIANGDSVNPEYSGHVTMRDVTDPDGISCSGILVNHGWVLTSEDCLIYEPRNAEVRMGNQVTRGTLAVVNGGGLALIATSFPFGLGGRITGFEQPLYEDWHGWLLGSKLNCFGYGRGGPQGVLRSASLRVSAIQAFSYSTLFNDRGQRIETDMFEGDIGGSCLTADGRLTGVHRYDPNYKNPSFGIDAAVSPFASWIRGVSRTMDDARFVTASDADGDGVSDLAWFHPIAGDFVVGLNSGGGGFTHVHNGTSGWGDWSNAPFFGSGDFDGNKRADWAWYAPWSHDFIVMLSSGDGHFKEVHNSTEGWGNWSSGSFFRTGDYDGNGRTDWSWYAPWSNDFIVMLSTGDGHFVQRHNGTAQWGNWSRGAHFATGDYDGNGLTDWSWYAPWSNDFIVMLSTGDGRFVEVHNDTSGWGDWSGGAHFQTGDYDGNGRTDWSWYAPWSNEFIVMVSNGDGTFAAVGSDTSGWGDWSGGAHFRTGDYDGNGRTDWSWYAPWSKEFIVMLSKGDGTFAAVGNDTSRWGNWEHARFFTVGNFDTRPGADWAWYAPWSRDLITMLSTGDGHFVEVHGDPGR